MMLPLAGIIDSLNTYTVEVNSVVLNADTSRLCLNTVLYVLKR